MRNTLRLVVLAAAGLAGTAGPADAQSRYPIKITRLQAGFPAGPFTTAGDEEGGKRPLLRAGAWAPVWVDLECTAKLDGEPLELVVETLDADEINTIARVPLLPPMQLGEHRTGVELGVLPYLKPGGLFPEVTASVRSAGGRTVAEPYKRGLSALGPSQYFIVSLGAALNGMALPRTEGGEPQEVQERNRELRNGQVQVGEIVEVGRMPDQWIGYQGVDLVVLTTGADPGFWDKLGRDRRRLGALAEWVRRGGRLVVSVGTNADLLLDDRLREIRDMLPATVVPGGKRSVASLRLVWTSVRNVPEQQTLAERNPREGGLTMAALKPRPDRSARTLIPFYDGNNPDPSRPLVVQGPYGLGKVTAVAFDLDRPPMTDWEHRAIFWEWLLNEGGHRLPSGQERSSAGRVGYDEQEDVYVAQLQEMLDSFEGVPVVSFGWVALFILIYILLIGPVDYLFLKRVVKRMEWTWVTFPVIVIAVSAIAYFAAYALKGRDLKVNKVDLVDVDLQSNRVYGHAWFTVFSPRIQSYTVGVEPAGPPADGSAGKALWTPEPAQESVADTVVSWFGRPKTLTQSFLRRDYRYHSDVRDPERLLFAAGLERVPIQVWSTKAFAGDWSARLDPERPLVEHTLRHPPDNPDVLAGTVTSRLPVEQTTEAFLLYRDRAIPLGQLVPGVERTVIQRPGDSTVAAALGGVGDAGRPAGEYGPRGRGVRNVPGSYRQWPMLFHDRFAAGSGLTNGSVRNLDQSWRVGEQSRDTAVLVLRVPTREGPAEEMVQSAESPTRLWLNGIPGGSAAREPLAGTLRQETYIRVFLSIPPAK